MWTPSPNPDRTDGPAPTGPSGFTLAEIMVVVVLIGVLLSVLLPRFGGMSEEERLRTAARRLAGLAQEAHSQAVTESRPYFLCLDLDLKQSWLSTVRPGQEGEAGRESRYLPLPADVVFQDAIHPSDGTVKTGRAAFGYWPQGGSEPGEIHLRNPEGREMTLLLRPYLGKTEIKDGYVHEETK